MARTDPHSHADDSQPNTTALDLDLVVDFDAKAISGTVALHLDRPAEGTLDLDTRDLTIERVADKDGRDLAYELAEPDAILGSRLSIETNDEVVRIKYRTAPGASALQWLDAAQTKGGKHPYVFTQCQAIHARSVLPCQDSPRVRSRYTATLSVPKGLAAVMAAAPLGSEDLADRVRYRFEMPQPIPSYLFAFAVGNIRSKEIGPRSRIYAEPETLEQAAWEFANVDEALVTCEKLFGPYLWDRFDLLVMPPSFPYGGMENPRLTFLTPTLLAGDRSLVNVVAHELAHSWTGNLVTNASINDFWLNEGWTVYAERRILEALEGEASKALHAALGRKGLERDVERLTKKDPKLTRLRNDLTGLDPDEVYSQVPYEKGSAFIVRLEQLTGRERFDTFTKKYIDHFKFRSIDTDDFIRFLKEHLGDIVAQIDLDHWIDGDGIPEDSPAASSEQLDRISAIASKWEKGDRPQHDALAALDPTEWQVLLDWLPEKLPVEDCAWLDEQFSLTEKKNYEILVGWLTIAARSGYPPADEAVKKTLLSVGRMKYLRPLYGALIERGADGRALAKRIFQEAKESYHPVGQAMVEGMIDEP